MLTLHHRFAKQQQILSTCGAIFIGYASTQKGYIMMHLRDSIFRVSRDVTFYEDIFHFQLCCIYKYDILQLLLHGDSSPAISQYPRQVNINPLHFEDLHINRDSTPIPNPPTTIVNHDNSYMEEEEPLR